jgi:mono/diheme cytochrome c family protein
VTLRGSWAVRASAALCCVVALSCADEPSSDAPAEPPTGAAEEPAQQEPVAPAPSASPPAAEGPAEPATFPEPDFQLAKAIYRRRCAFCHGERGDGKGPAAEALWPRPRSFVDEPFRFVSTDNGIPTEDDVFRVTSNGMPGSAMPPWRKLLSEAERREVVRYVLWLPKKALFDQELVKAEERRSRGKTALGPKELVQKVEAAFTPGRVFELPPKPDFTPAIQAKGARLYDETCRVCHGKRGDGSSEQPLRDSKERPLRARSFNLAYYKGGYSDEQLAFRILAGLPGSPMPAFGSALAERADVWPLVYRIRQFERPASGPVARGGLLFHQRGCASCHGLEGRGQIPNYNYITGTVRALDVVAKRMLIGDADEAKLVIDALTKGSLAALAESPPYPQLNVTLAQYDALRKLIREGNPAGRKNPRWGAPTFDMPAWKGELNDRQIDEILAYLISLQRWEDEEG